MKRLVIKSRSPAESACQARGVHLAEADLRRLYEQVGLSALAIADHYGCSASVIYQRLRDYGIPRRKPWAWQAVDIGPEALRRLYVDEGLTVQAIAERYGCSLATISRKLKKYGIPARPFNTPRYPRADFSGDPVEQAYLVGFRLGDLGVFEEGQTIVVSTSTTHQAQLDLLHKLFDPYGHVYEYRNQRGVIYVHCRLNQSFRFLLPKEDAIPNWILESTRRFLAFFAGYVDAEGAFQTKSTSPRLVVRTYDRNILMACWHELQKLDILAPEPGCVVKAGYRNKAGVVSRKATWALAVHRRRSLQKLIERLGPLMKHAKRQSDAQAVLRAIELPPVHKQQRG